MSVRRLAIVDRVPAADRWVRGDHLVRAPVRRLLRGRPRLGGLGRVRVNLLRGLQRIGVDYVLNPSFSRVGAKDAVCVLGRGRGCLRGYELGNPVVAGVGLMTHPSEWPMLCDEYPVARYLQHSSWARDVYQPFFGERCVVWPVGIDTDGWSPAPAAEKRSDFLIYDKLLWDRDTFVPELLEPIRYALARRGCSTREIRYGAYDSATFREELRACRGMVFLSPHESQGLAYQEALSAGVPVLAWDQGWCLDPNRFAWGAPHIATTSVPYWDDRCGERFRSAADFEEALERFLDRRSAYAPRDYVLEHLTLERSAHAYLAIVAEVNGW